MPVDRNATPCHYCADKPGAQVPGDPAGGGPQKKTLGTQGSQSSEANTQSYGLPRGPLEVACERRTAMGWNGICGPSAPAPAWCGCQRRARYRVRRRRSLHPPRRRPSETRSCSASSSHVPHSAAASHGGASEPVRTALIAREQCSLPHASCWHPLPERADVSISAGGDRRGPERALPVPRPSPGRWRRGASPQRVQQQQQRRTQPIHESASS